METILALRARLQIAGMPGKIESRAHRQRVGQRQVLHCRQMQESVIARLKVEACLVFMCGTIEVDIRHTTKRTASIKRSLWSRKHLDLIHIKERCTRDFARHIDPVEVYRGDRKSVV